MYMYEYVHKMDKIIGTPTLLKSYNNKNKATTNREATHNTRNCVFSNK